jgi:hypothetical protein
VKRLLAALLLVPSIGAAQAPALRVSGGWALAGYREQSEVLDFRGSGAFGRVDATWRRWGLTLRGERIAFTPTDPDINAEPFHGTETELALRYRPFPTLPAEVEGGVIRRTASPDDAAQGMRLFRLGAVAHFALSADAELDTRGAWLVGGRFSGGGSAATALTLGLSAAYRPLARFAWGWLVADYDFRRVDRTTDQPVPVQWSTVRLGLEARFIP